MTYRVLDANLKDAHERIIAWLKETKRMEEGQLTDLNQVHYWYHRLKPFYSTAHIRRAAAEESLAYEDVIGEAMEGFRMDYPAGQERPSVGNAWSLGGAGMSR
jgi:hypothetical protein